MEDTIWPIVIFVIIALLVGGVAGYLIHPSVDGTVDVNDTSVSLAINDAVTNAENTKNIEIDRLTSIIDDLKNDTEEGSESETETSIKFDINGYLIDNILLGYLFEETVFSDREVSTLFDGEVSFDGDDYNAEETLTLENIELKANGNDFEGIPYLTIPKEAIKFELTFDGDLETTLISGDELLKFDLFGEQVEMSSWDKDEIVFTKGIQEMLKEGESLTFDEKVILLEAVADDSVLINVDGERKSIDEGSIKTINGIEIKVQDLFGGSTTRLGFATLIVGEEVETTISDGDEYEEDSIWEWIVDESTKTIGLILAEEFVELDEDFSALTIGNETCLPNDYVCVFFNGMIEEESEKYTFELDTKGGKDYVEVNGNFQDGIEDFDRVYINAIGIYDEDLVFIDNETIGLSDFDVELVLGNVTVGSIVSTGIIIEDFEVNLDLTWTNVGSSEDNFLTAYGILVENPEDSCSENEFEISVPEERLEASVSLI